MREYFDHHFAIGNGDGTDDGAVGFSEGLADVGGLAQRFHRASPVESRRPLHFKPQRLCGFIQIAIHGFGLGDQVVAALRNQLDNLLLFDRLLDARLRFFESCGMRWDDVGHYGHRVASRRQGHGLRDLALFQCGDALLEILIDADFRKWIAGRDILRQNRRSQAQIFRHLFGRVLLQTCLRAIGQVLHHLADALFADFIG